MNINPFMNINLLIKWMLSCHNVFNLQLLLYALFQTHYMLICIVESLVTSAKHYPWTAISLLKPYSLSAVCFQYDADIPWLRNNDCLAPESNEFGNILWEIFCAIFPIFDINLLASLPSDLDLQGTKMVLHISKTSCYNIMLYVLSKFLLMYWSCMKHVYMLCLPSQ